MQLCHEPAPLRKARRIDSEKRSIFTVLATVVWEAIAGKHLLPATWDMIAGVVPREATHPMLVSYLFPAKCVVD